MMSSLKIFELITFFNNKNFIKWIFLKLHSKPLQNISKVYLNK